MTTPATTERKSPRELVTTRTISASIKDVFEAWANAEIIKKWWVPKSAPITLVSCKMDVRTGGTYRLGFKVGDQTLEFFGKYIEVTPNTRLQWTNEESGPDSANITTVTLKENSGATEVTVHDQYPSKETLDTAIEDGSSGAMPEQLEQLEALLTKPQW